MSKALEILKELHNKDVFMLYDLGLDHIDIYEAIAELEVQEGKQCCNCQYYDGYSCTNKDGIAHGGQNRIYPQDGCKEDFTPKATKRVPKKTKKGYLFLAFSIS